MAGISDEQHRLLDIQRVGLALSVIAGLTCVVYILAFFQTRAWQLLAMAEVTLVGGGIFFVARGLVRKGYAGATDHVFKGHLSRLGRRTAASKKGGDYACLVHKISCSTGF